MQIQISRKELNAIIDTSASVAAIEALMRQSGENPKVILEIISEAFEANEKIIFAPGMTYFGESDVLIIETREQELIAVLEAIKKHSAVIDGIVTSIFGLLFAFKALISGLGEDIKQIAKAGLEKDAEELKEHRTRTLSFLLWKRSKQEARARFGDLAE
jgi:hypothetical protein